MKKFKKIYIEITNICNLKCSFCPQDNLVKQEMSVTKFEEVIKKINHLTDYVYLHVKGEPLTHSKLDEIINICLKYNKKINITTNGVLLKDKYVFLSKVRQINVSLQSITNLNYLDDILNICDKLSENVYIEYRLWVKNKFENEILEKIKFRYNTLENKLAKNIYLSFDKEFVWPDLNNNILRSKGSCYATRDHIAILVDGTIIPCCLDSKGVIKLGNIFEEDIDKVIACERFLTIKKGFENNILEEELCKKCGFHE